MACVDIQNAQKTMTQIIEETKNSKIEVMYIDLSDFKAIDDFCEEVKSRTNTLDILINNAALIVNDYTESADGFELHFQVNYLGAFYLTKQLLPLLSKSPDGRVINISTGNYKYGTSIFSKSLKIYNPSDNEETLKYLLFLIF